MSERRTTALKRLLTRPEIAFLMEAHSGLSARIVEEAGFEGVWGSGLTISAAFGVRDNNELSWSQVVDHVAFMTETTAIPLLLDGDTGYGNFNNMRRLVRKLEQVGVAGVTIEDKLFPKTNSFLRSELQPLADVDEFCGKIKAGKDSQTDADFVLVARVEALIAGWGLAEAIKRAEAYHRAGADAILIHSRQSSPAEIFAFLDEWSDRAPVVLVPTKYWRTPTEEFRARRVSVVIWANHLLRAAIPAMQATAPPPWTSRERGSSTTWTSPRPARRSRSRSPRSRWCRAPSWRSATSSSSVISSRRCSRTRATGSRSSWTRRWRRAPRPIACARRVPTVGACCSTRCGSPGSATPSRPPRATACGSACCTPAGTAPPGCARQSPARAPTARRARRGCRGRSPEGWPPAV